MDLGSLVAPKGARKKRKRLGRGNSSGKGGTSTKGNKGAQSRAGYNQRRGSEGGQMPLHRRLPKRGFKNINRIEYNVINLDTLQDLATAYPGEEINHDFLVKHGIISNTRRLVKVLGRGELTTKIQVKLNKLSASAKAAIEAVGGTILEM